MWIEDGVPSHSMQFYCRSDSRKHEPESLRTEEEEEEERADRVECHRQKVEVISISSVIAIYNIKISLSLSLSSHLIYAQYVAFYSSRRVFTMEL